MASAHYQQIANSPYGFKSGIESLWVSSTGSTAWLDLSDENTVFFVVFRLRPQVNDFTFNGDGDDDGGDDDEDDDDGDNDKRQQRSVTPPHYQPTVEVLPVGTDSLESVTTELERPPKDFRGPKPNSAEVIDLTGDSNDEVSDLLRG
jgi:hypothetical protein